MKKFLSLIMAAILTVGVYAVVPKKYNPLPTTEVAAAKNYAGAYKVSGYSRKTVNIKYKSGNTWYYGTTVYEYNSSSLGSVVELDSSGYRKVWIGSLGVYVYADMKPFVSSGVLKLYIH